MKHLHLIWTLLKGHAVASIVIGAVVITAAIATPITVHWLDEQKQLASEPADELKLTEQDENSLQPNDEQIFDVNDESDDPTKEEENPQALDESQTESAKLEKNETTKKEPETNISVDSNKSDSNKKPGTFSDSEINVEKNEQDSQIHSIASSQEKIETEDAPTVTIEKFSKEINVYECANVETASGSDDYIARMSVYCIDDNSSNKTDFKENFKTSFGFYPTAEIQSQYIGEFLVNGYDGIQKIYQYIIEDRTYPLITDEFYVIKKKICADGSAWVGFPIPCSMDNMDTSQKVQDLLTKMNQTFCEWYDIDYSYAITNRDKFCVDMISVAGLMRTEDGQVLDVIYRYSRGVNMPVQ